MNNCTPPLHPLGTMHHLYSFQQPPRDVELTHCQGIAEAVAEVATVLNAAALMAERDNRGPNSRSLPVFRS